MRAGAFFVACLLSLAGARASAMTDDGRVVLVESPASRLSANARTHLRAAIAEVVAGRRLRLLGPDALPERLLRCELPACLPQIAAASGASLVVRVEAKYAKESFKLDVQLWNSDEGKLLGSESRDCPICDEQDLWGSAALLVQGLLDRAARPDQPSPAEAARAVAPPAPAPALATSPVQGSQSVAAGYAGLGLAVAGLSVLAGGIYYLGVDGRPACTRCDWLRDTAKVGLPMTIAGGVAVAVGTGLALWGFGPRGPSVALWPGGLRLAGRFP